VVRTSFESGTYEANPLSQYSGHVNILKLAASLKTVHYPS
jgi:hypothetical protein